MAVDMEVLTNNIFSAESLLYLSSIFSNDVNITYRRDIITNWEKIIKMVLRGSLPRRLTNILLREVNNFSNWCNDVINVKVSIYAD